MMIEAIAAVFPTRPVTLKDRSGAFLPMAFLFLLCVGIGFACLIMSWNALLPGIQRDWVIAKDVEYFDTSGQFAAPFSGGATISGECKSYGIILSDCDIKMSYRDSKGIARNSEFSLSFLDVSMGDYDVVAVRSASNPDLVSIDLAVDKLWNRIFTMGGIMLVGLLILAAGPAMVIKIRKVRADMLLLSGKMLIPVAVDVVSQTSVHGATTVKYTANTGSGVQKYSATLGKQKPFMLTAKDKALGLTAPGQSYVFLLDEALTRVDISDDERRAIRAARDAGEQKVD